jgi:RHS repeat-associated protein
VTRSTVATGANAPSSATSTSPGAVNKAVWRWDSDPFGTSLDNSKPTENPQLISGTQTVQQAGTFRQNMRFPGQVADGESAKYYNYFRDYDASIGRYTTSDPLGLVDGASTFSYVGSEPVSFIDETGEIKFKPPKQPPPPPAKPSPPSQPPIAPTPPPKKPPLPDPKKPGEKGRWNCVCQCYKNGEAGNPAGWGMSTGTGKNLDDAKNDCLQSCKKSPALSCQVEHCDTYCINSKGDKMRIRD